MGERYGYRMECGTHGPRGNGSMRHALRKLRAIHASTPIDRVLVTGDVTDAGTRAEWVEFLDLLRCWPDIRSRVLFVPGNHDVNIVDRTNTGRFALPWSVGQALRRLRFVVALGVIGRSQLKRLRALLNAFPERAQIILLHHHVVEYPVGSVTLGDRIALSLMNAPEVLSAIARHASHVVIFHGHRHHDWIGRSGDVALCSAPSVALGSVGPDLYRGSFHVNELALTGGGGMRLTSSARVTVS